MKAQNWSVRKKPKLFKKWDWTHKSQLNSFFKIESASKTQRVIELKNVKMAMEVEQSPNNQLGFPFWKPFRRRFEPDSTFFAPGNLERELLAKQVFFSFLFLSLSNCLVFGAAICFSFLSVWLMIIYTEFWDANCYFLFVFQRLLWN